VRVDVTLEVRGRREVRREEREKRGEKRGKRGGRTLGGYKEEGLPGILGGRHA
jgi:hypothetical protein